MNRGHLEFTDDNGDGDIVIFRLHRDGRMTVHVGNDETSASLFLSKSDAAALRDWMAMNFPAAGGQTVDSDK